MKRREKGYIHNEGGKSALHTGKLPPGAPTPLNCTAAGKAILAHLPKQRIEAIIDDGLEKCTENTVTDPESLRDELERIREKGASFSNEETISGIKAVAAPVIHEGDVKGAISISGPANRLEGKWLNKTLVSEVRELANIIEIKIIQGS